MEEEEEHSNGEYIIVLSDEESVELEPPVTPSTPLTPGAQLELCLPDWSGLLNVDETEENHYTSSQQESCDLDLMMELQNSEPRDPLQHLSPVALPGYMLFVTLEHLKQ